MTKKIFLFCLLTIFSLELSTAQKNQKNQKKEIKTYEWSPITENNYLLFSDELREPIQGSTYCKSTGKLYLLEGTNTILEYDIDAINNKEVKFSDNFDSYTAGSYLAQSNSAWTTWKKQPGTAEDGVIITNAKATSVPNSLLISGSVDQVYPFSNYTTGHYIVTFNMYVPGTGNGASFNIQHIMLKQWAYECYFYNNGTGYLSVGGSKIKFTYPSNSWFPVVMDVDLDQDLTSLSINNVVVNSWPFHYTAKSTTGGANQLAGIDLYAGAPNNLTGTYYVDDFTVTEVSADINKEVKRFIKLSFNVDTLQHEYKPKWYRGDEKDGDRDIHISFCCSDWGDRLPVEVDPKATKYKVPSVVEQVANAIVEVSPDGKHLALVEENHVKLHIIDILSGNEVRSIKLGKEYNNYWYSKDKYTCGPFAFLSNNEILVAGQKKMMLYNIENNKKKNISYPWKKDAFSHRTLITHSGYISNDYKILKYKNSEVTVLPNKYKDYSYNGCMLVPFDENEYIKYHYKGEKYTYYYPHYYDRRTDVELKHHWADSKNQYVFRGYSYPRKPNNILIPAIRALNNDYVYLLFQMNSDKNWKASFLTTPTGEELFYIYGDFNMFGIYHNKLLIFNHALTSREIEYNILKVAGDFDKLNQFISDYPNSIYKDAAKKKREDWIAAEWKKTSKPYDYSYAHFKDVNEFISKYALYGDVTAARKERGNIYEGAYNKLRDYDIQSIEQYIANFPGSPYLGQAKQKQMAAYRPGYEALCKEESSQPYFDYVKKYPNSPFLAEVKSRAKEIQEREKNEALAEKQRREAEALAEKQRKEAEALAEQKRKEAEALAEKQRLEAEQKRKEAERERQIAANSKVSTWRLGNKLCNCQKSHIMVVLDSWNENKSSFKGQIVTSDVTKFEGQLMKKGSTVWFDTKGWHKCLEDEIAYCTNHDVSNSSEQVSTRPTKKDPPYRRGFELWRTWSYTYKDWSFGREKKASVYIKGVVEDWNEDYTRVKIRVTYINDSGYSSSIREKYRVGSILWENPYDWKPQ
jgi:hypothetical protein